MAYDTYISSDKAIMLGKPCITGTRITVELILKKMGEGANVIDLIEAYPHISEVQILAAIQYAAAVIANDEFLLLA